MIQYLDEDEPMNWSDPAGVMKGMVAAGYDGPGWYFWDETQTQCYGPYPTALKAHEESWRYCKEVLGEEPRETRTT